MRPPPRTCHSGFIMKFMVEEQFLVLFPKHTEKSTWLKNIYWEYKVNATNNQQQSKWCWIVAGYGMFLLKTLIFLVEGYLVNNWEKFCRFIHWPFRIWFSILSQPFYLSYIYIDRQHWPCHSPLFQFSWKWLFIETGWPNDLHTARPTGPCSSFHFWMC